MSDQSRPIPQLGFTALELIIVLVIGFSIIALSASKMGELFNNSKTARSLSGLIELATSIRTLQGLDGYGNDGEPITDSLRDSKMVPKSFRTRGAHIQNDWNGNLAVTISNAGQGFTILYPEVPKGVCAKLARGLLDSGLFSSLIVNNDAARTLRESSNPQIIMTACAVPGDAPVSLLLEVDGPAAPAQ